MAYIKYYNRCYHCDITYPKILSGSIMRWLWKRFMCKRGVHLLDEVWMPDNWYLNCDACNLIIHIDKIDDKYVD